MTALLGILAAGVLFAVFALVSRERRRVCEAGGCGACGTCPTSQMESTHEPR